MTKEEMAFRETKSIDSPICGLRSQASGFRAAPGCVAFGELHNLSVFSDKMGVIKAFSLKSTCREQM